MFSARGSVASRLVIWVAAIPVAALLGTGGAARADIIGFDNGSGFTLNANASAAALGVPAVSGGTATLTQTVNSFSSFEATSVFDNTPQMLAGTGVTGFHAQFTYVVTGSGGVGQADGMAFVFQNQGPTARGGSGGGLGYSGISGNSTALEFNIFAGDGVGIALHNNGAFGSYISTSPVAINSGDPILVTLVYVAATHTLTTGLTDLANGNTFSTNFPIDLAGHLGSNTAFVGFTGSTGGGNATQSVSNFMFHTDPPIPEPGAFALWAVCGGVLLARRRRARRPRQVAT